MKICVPYFGGGDKYRAMLDAWLAIYAATGLTHEAVVLVPENELSDLGDVNMLTVDLSRFAHKFREGRVFDVKGALVSQAQVDLAGEDLLVLDADATVIRDPAPYLRTVKAPIGIPIDHGSLIYHRHPFLSAPYGHVRKLCAGVMFFGANRDGIALQSAYWSAFDELHAADYPWEPRMPHLLEQNAWSKVNAEHGGVILPHSFNWSERLLGPSSGVVINHDYGPFKMRS